MSAREGVQKAVFARVADALRSEFLVRMHVNSNAQTIIVWEDGVPFSVTVEEKRFRDSWPEPTRKRTISTRG